PPSLPRSSRPWRRLPAVAAPGAALLACGLLAGCGGGGPAAASTSPPAASSAHAAAVRGTPSAPASAPPWTRTPTPASTPASPGPVGSAAQPAGGPFSTPLAITNPLFPLAVGAQFTYEGKIVDSDGSHEHSVIFTVTDLVK